MKKVLVVGYKGNMGSRYTAILDMLGVEWDGTDLVEGCIDTKTDSDYDGVIIATPTDDHFNMINYIRGISDKPILCEKPIETSLHYLKMLLDRPNLNLRMINQYEYMPGADEADAEGKTYYNYFKSGRDGLAWDCINIIGMAKGDVELKNDSPLWECCINGSVLKLGWMDSAYIYMIDKWVKNPTNNHEYILKAHEKVIKWMAQ